MITADATSIITVSEVSCVKSASGIPIRFLISSVVASDRLTAGTEVSTIRSAIGLVLELLEQRAQIELRRLAAVGEDAAQRIALALDLPGGERRRGLAGDALLSSIAFGPAVALFALDPAGAGRGETLPSITRARAGIVPSGDERRAVAHYNVKRVIGLVILVSAAHNRRPAVLASTRKADPVRTVRRASGILDRLPGRASMYNNRRGIVHLVRRIGLYKRQHARHARRSPFPAQSDRPRLAHGADCPLQARC